MDILGLILLMLGGFAKGENELINDVWRGLKRDTLFNSKWWLNNNWFYPGPLIQWLMRFPLAMFKDGEHFTEWLGIVCLIFGVYFFDINMGLGNAIIAYLIYTVWINLSYHREQLFN